MDALYHFVLALAGGYILAKGLRMRYRPGMLVLTALASMALDLDHFIRYFGINTQVSFHSLYIALIPLILYLYIKSEKPQSSLGGYLLILSVLIYGHLAMDMVKGMYGIPLFYPLSDKLFLIPERWEMYLFDDETKPLVTTEGIGLTLYFGFIFILIAINSFSSGGALRRTDTRKGSSSQRTRSSLHADARNE
jgi:hypothetical protein